MKKGLEFIRDMTWEEVFATWEQVEEGYWDKLIAERGFANWKEWRQRYLAPFLPETRSWGLYLIHEPEATIPDFWVGPYPGWKKYFPAGAGEAHFSDLITNKDLPENDKIAAITRYFPEETTMMGIKHKDEVVLLDGTHRAAAITLAGSQNKKIASAVFIMLADMSANPEIFHKAHRQPDVTE